MGDSDCLTMRFGDTNEFFHLVINEIAVMLMIDEDIPFLKWNTEELRGRFADGLSRRATVDKKKAALF